MGILFPRPPGIDRAERPLFPLAGAAAAHAVLLLLVATVVPTEALTQTLKPIAVRLVEILPELPKPQAARPPRPARPRPAQPPAAAPLLTSNAPGETPASFVVPVQAAQAAPAGPVAAALAPAITAARFDADYLDNPQPIYPHASRRLGEQGQVLLRVYVSAAGLAEKVELKLGSGFARLDRAAQEAVGRWRFVPARRGEQTIAAWVQVPITFQLES
ncbi:MAG: energy transducer TonB [Sulfuritalea sp.]|nr:energy transducer TonB [Sulfuritalea sp.]